MPAYSRPFSAGNEEFVVSGGDTREMPVPRGFRVGAVTANGDACTHEQ
jgi:hypothetical protein